MKNELRAITAGAPAPGTSITSDGSENSAAGSTRAKFENHIKSSDTVVVFGCGGGRLLAGLDAQLKIGVEPGESARATATALGITCAASSAGLESEVADVVISNHALEHTLSPFDELCQLRRALRRRGTC